MAVSIEDLDKEQANLRGEFNQFDKRFERSQVESDNTRRELLDAINGLRQDSKGLSDRMDAGFLTMRQEFGTVHKWMWSFFIAVIIASCAVVGLVTNLFG